MKRIVLFMLVAVMLTSCRGDEPDVGAGFIPPGEETAQIIKSETLKEPISVSWADKIYEHNWQNAYVNYLSENINFELENVRISIFDLNNDNIPEVFIPYGDKSGMLYYNDNEIHLIHLRLGMEWSFHYNETTGQLFVHSSTSGTSNTRIYDFINGMYEVTLEIHGKKDYSGTVAWVFYVNGIEVANYDDYHEGWEENCSDWIEQNSKAFPIYCSYCHEYEPAHNHEDLSSFIFPFVTYDDVNGDFAAYLEEKLFFNYIEKGVKND